MVKFYQVGGSVRDEILGIQSKDIDYAVEAKSFNHMRHAIINRGGEIFLETPEYFTIRARVPELGACDYVLCRKESGYSDGRHPDKVEMGTIYDDLARRDFTMNAIAKTENGFYIDPHSGMEDIQNGEILCVGKPEDRFFEDSLRMLRALRFSVTLNMMIGPKEGRVLRSQEYVDMLSNVSHERIREELYKMFKANTKGAMHTLSAYYKIADIVFSLPNLWLMPTFKR